jgi:hypothetical protein
VWNLKCVKLGNEDQSKNSKLSRFFNKGGEDEDESSGDATERNTEMVTGI